MSPRAAWRLETLGFEDVSDYVAGKLDWMAAGLPTEGANSRRARAADVARRDAPTCGLRERLGDVSERAAAAGWQTAVVVNEEHIVLGLLRQEELASDPDQPVERAMRSGPSTFRPHVPVTDMAAFVSEHELDSSPITTSEGRLVGVLLKEDAVRAAHETDPGAEHHDEATMPH